MPANPSAAATANVAATTAADDGQQVRRGRDADAGKQGRGGGEGEGSTAPKARTRRTAAETAAAARRWLIIDFLANYRTVF